MFSSCFFCMLEILKMSRHLQLLVKWEVVFPNSRYREFYHEIGNIEKVPLHLLITSIFYMLFTYWLHIFKEGDLLYHTLKSQQTRKRNSGVSFTYDKFTNTLLNELNINHNMLLTQKDSNYKTYKSSLKKIAKLISSSCQTKYKDFFFKSLNEMKNDDTN